jgi:phenylacetate-CoA ligase
MINWRKPLIYVLLYLSGSKIPQNLKEIKSLENFSKKELKKYQEEKLKKLILHAYHNVPYYHKILKKVGVINNQEKVVLKNFNKIPILSKEIIRKEGENLYSKDHLKRKSYKNTSGGSTGEPIEVLQDKYYSDWNIANKIYYKTFAKQEIGEKELRLWGSEKDILGEKRNLRQFLKDYLYNRQNLNAFKMEIENLENYVRKINNFQPRWIESYVQPIYELANYIKKNNLKIYSPVGILTSAGTLYPYMKDLIEEVFNTKVYNRYGGRELGDVACSCGNSDYLHISIWNNFVELEESKNKLSSLLITNLNNFSMPIIRYRIGDIASFTDKKCNCRRSTTLLKKIEGRETSVFKKKDGSVIPSEFFIHFVGVVFNKGEINKFQIIQEDYEELLIKYVDLNNNDLTELKKKIEKSIYKVMGKNTLIKWKQVKDIKKLKSGKYLYTLSKV